MNRCETIDDLFAAIPRAMAKTHSLSAPGLHALLDLAHRVSLLREEGRSPRLLLFAPATERDPAPYLVNFTPPAPLTLEMVRRISPSIVPGVHALAVSGSARQLQCDGVVVVEPQQLAWSLLPRAEPFNGITVSIEAPGALSVVSRQLDAKGNHQILVLSLRGGAISRPYPFWTIAPMEGLLNSCVTVLARRHRGAQLPPRLPQALVAVVDALVGEAVEFGHGGTFVFLPPTAGAQMQRRNLAARLFPPAAADLGALVLDMFRDEELPHHEAAERLLLESARAVGRLAGTDGCVVLDYGLRLRTFGTRITTSETAKPRMITVDPWLHRGFGEPRPIEAPALNTLGTRHHSAARLCAAVPGTTAIVISHDADIRVFVGAKGRVADCGALAFIPSNSHVPRRPPP